MKTTTDTIQNVPFRVIGHSPLNPRSNFNQDTIEELAQSIASKGILQNLVVRPVKANKNGKDYEIIAGERRLRAVEHLVNNDLAGGDFSIPVRVQDCDDLDFLRLSTIENVQREDIHPLDEANAYLALRTAGDSAEAIGRLIGKTKRHVELRLQLTENLEPGVKKAFAKNDVSLAMARVLATVSTKRQKVALKEVKRGAYHTAEDLKDDVYDKMYKTSVAFFPLEQYKGIIVPDEDDPKYSYFDDTDQFLELQNQAIEAKKKQLAKKYTDVLFFGRREYFHRYEYEETKDPKRAIAVIEVEYSGAVEVTEGLAKKIEKASTGGATNKKDDKPKATVDWTKKHLAHVKNVKTRALQTAIANSNETAMRLCCFALMGGDYHCHIKPDAHAAIDHVLSVGVKERLESFRGHFGKQIGKESSGATYPLALADTGGYHDMAGLGELKAYKKIEALKPAELQMLFTSLVAARCGTFTGYEGKLGDRDLAVHLAGTLNVDLRQTWQLDTEYLDGCNKLALLAIINDLGIVKEFGAKGVTKLTLKALREGILSHVQKAKNFDAYIPPSARFGSYGALMTLAQHNIGNQLEAEKKPEKKAKAKVKPAAKKAKPKTAAPKKATKNKARKNKSKNK